MPKGNFVTVEQFFKDHEESLQLSWISGKKGGDREIREGTIGRCGYALVGHFDFQSKRRLHVFGMAETSFLKTLSQDDKEKNVRGYFETGFPCLVFARNLVPDPLFITCSNERDIPIFLSPLVTTTIVTDLTFYFDRRLAPSILIHGSLVSIDGSGVLVRGQSGIGKSEAALELVRRGCALVGDDAICVKRMGGGALEGTVAHAAMRGCVETRDLGLLNLIRLYGVDRYRFCRNIDLVVTLQPMDTAKQERGAQSANDKFRIMGVDVPHVTIYVAPGRDIATLIEVAAKEFRMRQFGVHTGMEINQKLIESLREQDT